MLQLDVEADAQAGGAAAALHGVGQVALSAEESRLLGGHEDTTHLVRGLDTELLRKTRERLARAAEEEAERAAAASEEDGKAAANAPNAANVKFHSAAAKTVFEVAVRGTTAARQSRAAAMFSRGRTAYAFQLSSDADAAASARGGGAAYDVPSTLQRPRAEWEALEERVLVSADTLVLAKLVQLMSYMRASGERRKASRKKERVAKSMGMTVEAMEAMLRRQGLAEAAAMAGLDNVPGLPGTGSGAGALSSTVAASAAAPVAAPTAPAAPAPPKPTESDDEDIFGDVDGDGYVCEPAPAAPTAGPAMPPPGDPNDYGLEGFEGPAMPAGGAGGGDYGLEGMEDAAGPAMPPPGDAGGYGLEGMEDAAMPAVAAAAAGGPAAVTTSYFEGLSAGTDAAAAQRQEEEKRAVERAAAAAAAAPAALASAAAPSGKKKDKAAPKGALAFGIFSDADDADGGYDFQMDYGGGRGRDDEDAMDDGGKRRHYDRELDSELGKIRGTIKEKHGGKHESAFEAVKEAPPPPKREAEDSAGAAGRRHKRVKL